MTFPIFLLYLSHNKNKNEKDLERIGTKKKLEKLEKN
jgi:hypothetical protein